MPTIASESIAIPVAPGDQIEADVSVPNLATGLVIFAHGSGSSRFSSRNRAVAKALQEHGLGTVLLDLLTRDEEQIDLQTAEYRFDVEVRVMAATDWLQEHSDLQMLPIGYFGASS